MDSNTKTTVKKPINYVAKFKQEVKKIYRLIL